MVHRIRDQAEILCKKKKFVYSDFIQRSYSRFNIMYSIIDPYETYVVVCICDSLFSVF